MGGISLSGHVVVVVLVVVRVRDQFEEERQFVFDAALMLAACLFASAVAAPLSRSILWLVYLLAYLLALPLMPSINVMAMMVYVPNLHRTYAALETGKLSMRYAKNLWDFLPGRSGPSVQSLRQRRHQMYLPTTDFHYGISS